MSQPLLIFVLKIEAAIGGKKQFAKLRALRVFMPYMPSRFTRLPAFAPSLRAFLPPRITCLPVLHAFAPYVP